jgi:hypothetical protein
MDGVQKTYSSNMYEKYKNKKITDGLSSIKNLTYKMNDLLDINYFECEYNPSDNSLKTLTLQSQPIMNAKPKIMNRKIMTFF